MKGHITCHISSCKLMDHPESHVSVCAKIVWSIRYHGPHIGYSKEWSAYSPLWSGVNYMGWVIILDDITLLGNIPDICSSHSRHIQGQQHSQIVLIVKEYSSRTVFRDNHLTLAYSVTLTSLTILNSDIIGLVQKGTFGSVVCIAPSNPTHITTILRLTAMVTTS